MAMVGWHLEKIGDVDVSLESRTIFTGLRGTQDRCRTDTFLQSYDFFVWVVFPSGRRLQLIKLSHLQICHGYYRAGWLWPKCAWTLVFKLKIFIIHLIIPTGEKVCYRPLPGGPAYYFTFEIGLYFIFASLIFFPFKHIKFRSDELNKTNNFFIRY